MISSQQKLEHIDKEGFRICSLFTTTKLIKDVAIEPKGSIVEAIHTDVELTENPEFITSITLFGEVVAIEFEFGDNLIKLTQENFIYLKKLALTIYKDEKIKSTISLKFIEEQIIQWCLETVKSQKAKCSLSNFLLNAFEESIEEFKIHYPILNLNIGTEFYIGDVLIGYFTKDYIDFLSKEFLNKNPSEIISPFESRRKELQGRVFARYITTGEEEKAKEVAFEHCAVAVDVLKICSDTIDFPQHKISFDIDRRTKENLKNEIFIVKVQEPDSFKINFSRGPSIHQIYNDEWLRMKQNHIEIFSSFLKTDPVELSELKILIINSIKRFANALSTSNLHQRIIELFTILESLLLPNENANIMESLTKYCSKIVSKKIEVRERLIKLIKKMYSVRSKLVHHGIEDTIDMEDLKELQKVILYLLVNLIHKSKIHLKKATILKEIDDAILAAY